MRKEINKGFGKEGEWDASIKLNTTVGDPVELKVLLKDNSDVMAIAVSNMNSGRTVPTDAYYVSIDKKNSAVRYESKFQRILATNGNASNGWSRHAKVYVKGTFDSKYQFTNVNDIQGIYSDISVNVGNTMPTSPDAAMQRGVMWTVKGSDSAGFKSNSYQLGCTGNNPYTCQDVNKSASWTATAGSGACNSELSGTTCSGSAIDFTTDAEAAFLMDKNHGSFLLASDWFNALAIQTWTDVSFN